MDGETGRVLSGPEAVRLDEERAAQAEARRVAFWGSCTGWPPSTASRSC